MQDRPSATEILATIGEYLDQDVLPITEGALRYHTLVAANLIKVLERELAAGEAPGRRQRDDLLRLLGDTRPAADPAVAPAAGTGGPNGSVEDDLSALNAELQARLLAPELPSRQFLVDAREVIEAAVLDKLAVNKPGYARYDMAGEVG